MSHAYHPLCTLFFSDAFARHWQLRSLIGSEKNSLIYFPSGSYNAQIKKLNTTTCECETIKVLPFEPRCLVAQNGWLCCGGETGDFAAVRLDQPIDAVDPIEATMLDVDPLLQVAVPAPESDPPRIDGDDFSLRPPRPRQPPPRTAQTKTFGQERVNCITMWFPPTLLQRFEGTYQEPVAVLANNDKNVTTVSLRNEEALDEISYPDCVNRAVMSPDGKLLVAVSDDPYLYVHERVPKSGGIESRRSPSTYYWKEVRKIHLRGQIVADKSENRGSFAVCFSSAGRLLAVGTQYGAISIFDVVSLTIPSMDSLITHFKSSRAQDETGAVRDMAFAPGSIDLLAWSEDRGNIGVADIRTGFVCRQILRLDQQDNFEHINVVAKSPASAGASFIDPRLLEGPNNGHDALSSTFASTLDLTLETSRTHTRDLLERYSSQLSGSAAPLSPEETRVLEALQEHRRRRDQRAAERAAARASGQPSAAPRLPWTERSARSGLAPDASRNRERSLSSSLFINDALVSVRDQMRDLEARHATSSRTVRDILGSVRDQLRTTEERLQGLQASIRETRDNRDQPETEPSPSRRTPINRLMASTPPPPPPPAPSGGWADLDALYNLTFDSNPTLRNLRESTLVDADQRLRRERMTRLIREYQAAHHTPTRYPSMLRERSDPHDTAGLAWSEDGQTL